MIEGIIDCYHGDSVDLAAFKHAGGLAVWLKATQGTRFIDPLFVPRLMQAQTLGLMVGAYHFCDGSEPAQQAHHFLSLTGAVPGLKLMIDVEPNGRQHGGTATIPQAAQLASAIHALTGTYPVYYGLRDGPDGRGTGLPNVALMQCPLWIAHVTDRSDPGLLPLGWNNWLFWQYTFTGNFAGMTHLDRDRFNGTAEELRAWWSS